MTTSELNQLVDVIGAMREYSIALRKLYTLDTGGLTPRQEARLEMIERDATGVADRMGWEIHFQRDPCGPSIYVAPKGEGLSDSHYADATAIF